MPEKPTPTDGEQSLEGPQKTAQQLAAGMRDYYAPKANLLKQEAWPLRQIPRN